MATPATERSFLDRPAKAEPTKAPPETSVQPPMLANQQLVTAMSHPTRAHAVTVLNGRVARAAEIGRELKKPARHVSYYLKVLEKLGVVELVPWSSRTYRFDGESN